MGLDSSIAGKEPYRVGRDAARITNKTNLDFDSHLSTDWQTYYHEGDSIFEF
jgi:hypothetical protein